jgi:hypothetical protein
MPTTAMRTYSNKKLEPFVHPQLAVEVDVALKAADSATYELARGTLLGEVTATGKFVAYDDDGTDDGRRVARGILTYDVSVDTNGKITLSTTAGVSGADQGDQLSEVPMYVSGFFAAADLTGLDANGLADLQGFALKGDLSTGVIKF